MSPGRPTLKTVAELSGLAVATVSRARANDPRIAKAARRLRTGKTMVID
ncbi:LacI family DNA-binding transcriptional regulator [Aliiruegeria lutimaris]|uniref:Regulatory protein, lacI family n=1 Tax=Aliiruegeria lutimaris TaxID=571298 RepID=A0A1G8X3Z0_9RHOB|nr:LacI family DNA-binding transcriptional regulator [Aliiruegeria lutimaris]SDJ85243.1 regulatory protein, lacI family [Aliiruegeria lutimaris]